MLLSIQSRSRLFGKFTPTTLASTPLQNFLTHSSTTNFHYWPNQQCRGFRAETNQVPTGTSALRDAPVRDHWSQKARQERAGRRAGNPREDGGSRGFGGRFGGDTGARRGAQSFDRWSQNRARPAGDEEDEAKNEEWYDESDSATEGEDAKKDPWAVGPWNEGQPSLIYECIPGTDLRPVFAKMAKDMNEGTINDTVENRYHYKRSRKNFQRRLFIRRMGWVDNNAYLTKLAKAQKEARDSAKDAKGRVGRDFVVRPLFAYHGKPIIAESSSNIGFSSAKSATTSSGGKSQPVILDLEDDGEPGSKKLKKNQKKKL